MASGARGILLLCGAGFGGSYLYTNSEAVMAVVREMSRAAVHEISKPKKGSSMSSGEGGSTAGRAGGGSEEYRALLTELTSKVNDLTSKIVGREGGAAAAPAAQPVMVVSRGAVHGRGLNPMLVPVGIIVFCATTLILRRRGVTWSDIAGVTQNIFATTMEGMQRGLSVMTSTLRSVKDDLAEKIWRVEEKMLSTNREIRSKIETAVADARKSVDDVGTQVDKLQQVVNGLDSQFSSIDDSMVFAVRGVYMLCKYVSEIAHVSPKAQSDLDVFLEAAEGADERSRLQQATLFALGHNEADVPPDSGADDALQGT